MNVFMNAGVCGLHATIELQEKRTKNVSKIIFGTIE